MPLHDFSVIAFHVYATGPRRSHCFLYLLEEIERKRKENFSAFSPDLTKTKRNKALRNTLSPKNSSSKDLEFEKFEFERL